MNIEDINSTITKLESDETTFGNCEKLASLYIVREHYLKGQNEAGNDVQKEIQDILPQYHKYIEIKKRYQMGETSEKVVENAIKPLCKEILELVQTLYRCTDMPEERAYIKKMVNDLQNIE